jgi:Tfp pilus assembly protein PilV
MRRLALTIAPIAALLVFGTPAQAQTYDPSFPICLQTYGISGNGIDCSYTSMDQCRASASGRAAQCISNPYYAAAPSPRRGPRLLMRRGAPRAPANVSKEVLMRTLAWTILSMSAICGGAAQAQTYGTRFPVCIQTYEHEGGIYISCEYTSMAACQATASGRAAQCINNPYYASAQMRRRGRAH